MIERKKCTISPSSDFVNVTFKYEGDNMGMSKLQALEYVQMTLTIPLIFDVVITT